MALSKRPQNTDGYIWRCRKKLSDGQKCDSSRSIRRGTWFTGSHLDLRTILALEIIQRTPRKKFVADLEVSPTTVTDWTQFVRETFVDYLENHSGSIGGPGKIVEIDESKFGRRRYNRGHYVEGQWVLGGIERHTNKMFLVAVHNRSSQTLTDCIRQWVLPGTTIYIDCWTALDRLGELGYNHLTVNHSLHFVDPDTGTHTNTIEGMWRHIKFNTHGYGRKISNFQEYLGHYLFDRLVKSDNVDGYLRFLHIVSRIDWSTMSPGTWTTDDDDETEDDEN
ncbi:hypothetical protein AAG570_011831 [Ranatra chinensis]|uniref:ISXO2-like transposase domain-containing protein n=1 Tax=Ranatra chinensis TaxID=642074 RepID=A0ABD0YH92_9HEMI